MATPTEKGQKTARRPLFGAGARVTTRYAVKLPKPLGRFLYLRLLPGTEWTVKAVELRGERAPVYTLTAGGFEIRRQEWRLRALAKPKKPKAPKS
ncbi:MAG TPA: hypothetical protein VGE74_21065 [Gemmata sp.]